MVWEKDRAPVEGEWGAGYWKGGEVRLFPHLLIHFLEHGGCLLEFGRVLFAPGAGQVVQIIVDETPLLLFYPQRLLEEPEHKRIDAGSFLPRPFLESHSDSLVYAAQRHGCHSAPHYC